MKKKKSVIIVILFLSILVNAAQDSFITIDSKGSGLCLSVDGLTDTKCQNQTLTIEGTNDHILYIQPETVINEKSNITEKMNYIIFTPLNLVVGGFFIWIVFAFVIMIALSFMLLKGIIKV